MIRLIDLSEVKAMIQFRLILFFLILSSGIFYFNIQKDVDPINVPRDSVAQDGSGKVRIQLADSGEFEHLSRLITDRKFTELIDVARLHESDGEDLWRLAFHEGIPETTKRNLLAEAILRMGKEQSSESILTRIMSELSPGQTRTLALGQLFNVTDVTIGEFQVMMGALDFDDEREYASVRFGHFLAEERRFDRGELLDLFGSSEHGKKAVLASLIKHPFALRGEPEGNRSIRLRDSLEMVLILLKNGVPDHQLLDEFLLGVSNQFAGEALEFFIKNLSAESVSSNTVENLLRKMSRSDPQGSLDLVLSNPSILEKVNIHDSFLMYAYADGSGAIDWLNENEDIIPPVQLDQAKAALGTFSLQRGEFDTAWEWSKEINDPELRKTVEGQIWGKEKKVIESSVKTDPQGAMNSIVSGDSGHSEYWIKNAFERWSSVDSGKAAAWYDENRKTLTPSQNQHVARVYAEQAIESGDFDTANQWLGHVNEEKFREALVKQIQAASEAVK